MKCCCCCSVRKLNPHTFHCVLGSFTLDWSLSASSSELWKEKFSCPCIKESVPNGFVFDSPDYFTALNFIPVDIGTGDEVTDCLNKTWLLATPAEVCRVSFQKPELGDPRLSNLSNPILNIYIRNPLKNISSSWQVILSHQHNLNWSVVGRGDRSNL